MLVAARSVRVQAIHRRGLVLIGARVRLRNEAVDCRARGGAC